jgi:acyl-CoA thioesterase I
MFATPGCGLPVTLGALPMPLGASCEETALGCTPGRAYEALQRGESVRLVGFGASVTSGGAWLGQVESGLEAHALGDLVVVNAAESARWSGWGVDTLEERVLSAEPDLVLIEFAINDAYTPFETSLEEARANWVDMIDRIRVSRPDAEIVLMTMNLVTGDGAAARPDLHAYYRMVRELAALDGLALVDAEPVWAEILVRAPALYDELVPDGVHPSAHAHCRITSLLVIAVLRGCVTDAGAIAEAIITGPPSPCCAP